MYNKRKQIYHSKGKNQVLSRLMHGEFLGNLFALTVNGEEVYYNSLHYTPEKQQNDIYHKLYSDLLLMRDICQYGRIDNWGLAKVVEQRGLGNINKHIRGPKIKALKARRL